jgi:hypothetical protein
MMIIIVKEMTMNMAGVVEVVRVAWMTMANIISVGVMWMSKLFL